MTLCFIVASAICLVSADSIMKNTFKPMTLRVVYLSLVWLLPAIGFALFTFFYGKCYSFAIPKAIFLSYGCILTVINLLILAFLITDLWDIGNKIPFSLSVIVSLLGMILFPGAFILVIGRWITEYEGELSFLEVFLFLGTTFIGWAFYAYLITKCLKKRKMRRINTAQYSGENRSSHEP